MTMTNNDYVYVLCKIEVKNGCLYSICYWDKKKCNLYWNFI